MEITTVKLYGELGFKFGKEFKFFVNTFSELINALSVNFKEFKQYVKNKKYHIFINNTNIKNIFDCINLPVAGATIKIIPIIQGSGFFKKIFGIVVGIALIYLGLGPLSGFWFSNMLVSVGFSLIFGGISSLLFSPSAPPKEVEPKELPSYNFNGAVNTFDQGGPVPIGYGKLIIGSAVITADVRTAFTDTKNAST